MSVIRNVGCHRSYFDIAVAVYCVHQIQLYRLLHSHFFFLRMSFPHHCHSKSFTNRWDFFSVLFSPLLLSVFYLSGKVSDNCVNMKRDDPQRRFKGFQGPQGRGLFHFHHVLLWKQKLDPWFRFDLNSNMWPRERKKKKKKKKRALVETFGGNTFSIFHISGSGFNIILVSPAAARGSDIIFSWQTSAAQDPLIRGQDLICKLKEN